MNANVDMKIKQYLRFRQGYEPQQVGSIIHVMRQLAGAVGFDLDNRFAYAGLGAGPEARIASEIVSRSTLAGALTSGEPVIRKQIELMLKLHPEMHTSVM